LDKLTNSVVSNTKKSLSVAKTEVDREKVDSKDFIYYLTNALVAYAEGLKN
jgi:hypothetical protein